MASSKRTMWALLGGAAAGAAALYFFDRERGHGRREALARKAQQLSQQIAENAMLSVRDAEHRLSGAARHIWTSMARAPLDDRVQIERVRARMGRVIEHPHRIHVAADEGVITLWGEATEHDARRLVYAVESMPGVREVQNHLELREAGAFESEAQTFAHARHESLLRWSPAKRLLAGGAGMVASLYGWHRKDRLGSLIALFGGTLAARSMSRKTIQSMLAFSEDSPGFELDKTIRINAPASDIYQFWTNPENYPKVFSHIAAIDRVGENLYRWTMNGPAGVPIHWKGTITRTVPNTSVEWKSLPGSTVGNFGIVRFDPNYDASTRVRIRMFYRPPGGILGRFVAEIFGSTPGSMLNKDLRRMKALLEKDSRLFKEAKEGGEELLKIATT